MTYTMTYNINLSPLRRKLLHLNELYYELILYTGLYYGGSSSGFSSFIERQQHAFSYIRAQGAHISI